MTKRIIPIVVGLIVVLAATAATARQPGPGRERDRGPRGEFIQNLSAEQRTAMREIMEKHREEMESLRTELEAKSAELRELVKAEVGETAIFAKIDEIGALRTEMMKKRMEMQLEIRAQLTDEQKQEMDEKPFMKDGRPGRGSGGRGPGGPGGPGAGGGFE
jgi:Spy/CpxP family protein refolding chaperone